MITLSSFSKDKLGTIHKKQSDMIMEYTWNTDIAAKTAYMYDFFHDDHIYDMNDLHPEDDEKKVPVEIKFLKNASQTFEKDMVTFHIQFKPSYDYTETDLVYYDEMYKNIYNATFPIGMYIDIPDERGKYNKWLVVNLANFYVNQFPTYEVLPINYILQYIYNGIKYEVPVVLRSQNSYNSGLWVDFRIETVQDQQKFIVPLNRETEKIYYNQRIIIDNKVKTEPRTWKVSKVNRIAPNGVAIITTAQDRYDSNKDYIEFDDNENVIGMWADYYASSVLPEDYNPSKPVPIISSKIIYSGTKSELKVGGSYKTFTVKYYDEGNEISPETDGIWQYVFDGVDITTNYEDYIDIISVDDCTIKIKFIGDRINIGKILTISYTSTNSSTSLDIGIVGL